MDSLRHGRRHSVALSEHRITVDDPPSQLGMAKIHLIDQQHEDEVITQSRLICLENEESLYHLMERIKTKFGLDKVKLKYRDQDGDLITMCEDSDLQAALEAGLLVRGSIKVVLWCLPRG